MQNIHFFELNKPHCGRTPWMRVCVYSMCLLLAGCAATGGAVGKALEAVGLKTPELNAENAKKLVPDNRKITLRIHAADQLNTDAQLRSLSVVVRIYKLKRIDAFMSAPYSGFADAQSEKAAVGDDIAEVREIVLRPGQKHEVIETLSADIGHLAVVALFRTPVEGRWRFAFDAKQAEQTGITLGVHGCAMSVAAGMPERTPQENLRLAGVQCR
jgi:type VI secretion system protein VasD